MPLQIFQVKSLCVKLNQKLSNKVELEGKAEPLIEAGFQERGGQLDPSHTGLIRTACGGCKRPTELILRRISKKAKPRLGCVLFVVYIQSNDGILQDANLSAILRRHSQRFHLVFSG